MKIVVIDTLILLVLSMNVIDGLWCIEDDYIQMSLIELTHEELQQKMDHLARSDYNNSARNMACAILIVVNYTAKQLTIYFAPGFEELVNSGIGHSVFLETTFTRTPHRNRISELMIICSFEDMCDENFITQNNHSQWWWLIDEVNYAEIEKSFEKLFIKDEPAASPIRCYNDSIIGYCSSEQCSAKEASENNLYTMCSNGLPVTNYLTIRTVVLTNTELRQLKHGISYTCQFDICNERSIFLKARNITDTYYNVTRMLRIFNENPTAKPTSTPVVTQFSRTPASLQSSFKLISIKSNSTIAWTEPNSVPVMVQSTTEVSSTTDHLRVSIKLLSLIFPICALSFLEAILSITV